MRAGRPLKFPEFVAMMAMMFATVAFSIDAMLPGLATIAQELSPDQVNRVQLVVTIFMLGLGVGMLVAGPVSDTLGRKSVVVGGLVIYCSAALLAAQAQSLEVLLAARFVQGLGASGARTVTLAMVRDLYAGRAMARVMSIVMTIFILVPIVAPTIGAWIMLLAGWRAIFLAFVLFGLLAGGWLLLRQPETLPPEARRPLGLRPLRAALGEVLASRQAVLCTAALTLGFSQMLVFLSMVPQIFADVFGRVESFPYWFGGVAVLAGWSGLVNAALVMRLGMRRLAATAFGVQAAVAAAYLIATLLPGGGAPWDFFGFLGFMGVSFFMIGLSFGNLNALALEPLGHIAGLAAAVVGAVSTVIAVMIAAPIGQLYDGTTLPLAGAVMLSSTVALILVSLIQRKG